MRIKNLVVGAGFCLLPIVLNQSPAKSSFAMSAIVYEHVDVSKGEGFGTTVYFGKDTYQSTSNLGSFFPYINDKVSFI